MTQILPKCQPVQALTIQDAVGGLAYFLDGTDLVALAMTAGGTYQGEIGRAPDAGLFLRDRASRIYFDDSGHLMPDAILWSRGRTEYDDTENGVFVADVRSGTTYSLTSGFDGNVVFAGFNNGFIYFITHTVDAIEEFHDARIYRITSNLDSIHLDLVETVTMQCEEGFGGFLPQWGPGENGSAALSGGSITGSGVIFGSFTYFYTNPTAETSGGSVQFAYEIGGGVTQDTNSGVAGFQAGSPWGARALVSSVCLTGDFPQNQSPFPDGWPPPPDAEEISAFESFGDPTGSFAFCFVRRSSPFPPGVLYRANPISGAQISHIEVSEHPTLGIPEIIAPL